MSKKVVVVGSGNAAMCAGIAALEQGSDVLMLEKADEALAGGNSRYTAGAMRFVYESDEVLLSLVGDKSDPRIKVTDFGTYTAQKFGDDLQGFNEGRLLSPEQQILIAESTDTLRWLAGHGIKFEPIYSRQSFQKGGRYVFWGGLTLASRGEGVGLLEMEREVFLRLGGRIRYESGVTGLLQEEGRIKGVEVGKEKIEGEAVILASGGFEANPELRKKYIGDHWEHVKVRGTPHNTGDGLTMAFKAGAAEYGFYEGCHATPVDYHMADYGGLHLSAMERKNYRKVCYFLGVMLNADGERFVDEGLNFRNYTYAQFGHAIMAQSSQIAWQIFDAKVFDLLYEEYGFADAHYLEADSLEGLIFQIEGLDHEKAMATLENFNCAVDDTVLFDPTVLDGKSTKGLSLSKSHWAQRLDQGPFRAYPVTGGITFTYGGVKVRNDGGIVRSDGCLIEGLYGCGELVGGVFYAGYPGGSGLTSGSVFGRRAGVGAGKGSQGSVIF